MAKPEKKEPKARLGKERWLHAALEMIAQEGGEKVRIEALASKLGVTKGSFYHHFRDRQDFTEQVVDFWVTRFNQYVIETIGIIEGSGEDRFKSLVNLISRENLGGFDTTMRAWAARDPNIGKKVREVDNARYTFVRQLFSEMGFEDKDLELRTRIWLVFAAASTNVHFPNCDGVEENLLSASSDFFIRR